MGTGFARGHQPPVGDLHHEGAAGVDLIEAVRADIVQRAVAVIADHAVAGCAGQGQRAQRLPALDVEYGDQAVGRGAYGSFAAIRGDGRAVWHGIAVECFPIRREAEGFHVAEGDQATGGQRAEQQAV